MTTPLITKIASILGNALPSAGVTESATLTRSTPGTRTPGALAEGTNPTTTSYSCKGFVSSESFESIDGTIVERGDKVVCLIGLGAVKPKATDTITIDSQTLKVTAVEGTVAIWTCLCRR
jgi:hypothetical protein